MSATGAHRVAVVLAAAALTAALGACHRRPAVLPAPAEAHCWESVMRSPLPPDSVVRAFNAAYWAVGLTEERFTGGDTAWAFAGPTVIGRGGDGATYTARVVAVRADDGSHFRTFVTVGPPPGGWTQASDTADGAATRRLLATCTDITARANVHATRGPLDGEERLPVWGAGRPGAR